MYFKRIEMHGFKSFAEPVTIEFDRGITCVVGPNGSGKSNISDAIRWVLGEQSPKMLRGGKMEDVIFAGTASRKSRGMAEVTLVIDNSTGILPIEYQEVAITRRMYRSGESEYAINNNQCRMKDIRELLMDTGIGVDGYSLIGQGKISDIISNKSDSIREIFEETAGIVSYRSKKADAEKKLASSNLNMDRVNDIILELEERIGPLKEDSEKATEYIALRDRHKELEINITVKSIEEISEKVKVLSDDLEGLTKELGSFSSIREELDRKIQVSKEKLSEYELSIEDANSQLSQINDDINNFVSEKNISRERLHAMEKDSMRITNEIKEIEEKIAKEQQSGQELIKQKQAVDEKLKKLEDELNIEIQSHSDAVTQKTKLTAEIDQNKNDMYAISNKKSGWMAEKLSLERLVENLNQNEEQLMMDRQKGSDSHKLVLEQLSYAKEEKSNLEDEIESLKNEKSKFAIEIDVKTSENQNLQDEVQKLGVEIGKKAARKKTIEEMESNYEGYNGGVKFVMKSNIAGINGVVAELIEVPKGYELAMETALGGTMQNIVCEDDSTAKKAVNLLKEKKGGRVTFLPVKSIRPRPVIKDDTIENMQGFKGYGVECIGFEPKFQKIFEYLLGNVVIVDNMDNAIEISKKGNNSIKYVTLEGEIISTAGAVTGGRFKNKSANILERRGEIAELENTIKELEKQKVETLKKTEEYQKVIDVAKKNLNEVTASLREKEVELLNKSNQVDILNKSVEDFTNESAKWEATLENLKQEHLRGKKSVDEVSKKILDADNKIVELTDKIEKATTDLENMQDELNEASESITKARIEVTSCQGEKENIDNLQEISNQNIAAFIEEKEQKQRQIENICLDREALTKGVDIKENKIAQLKIEKEKFEHQLREATLNKANIGKIYGESSNERETINSKTTRLQNQKYEIDVKLARQEGQLDGLKNKLWEDFEISYAQALSMKSDDFVVGAAIRENRQIKNRIKELGEVNVGAIKEYAQVKERYEFLTEQREDIQKSTDELNKIIFDMDKVIREKFKESFDQVVEHFENTFVEFFGGGHAKITLDNEADPLNATIEITAQPPGKQLKNINLMSGGEKTMTAIALMFAVLKTKPTPCCILDEVEAALDDHNIHVFANYLKKFDNIQFTLITHQKTTMEHADVMYGVTMPERGISKVFSLKMGDELPV